MIRRPWFYHYWFFLAAGLLFGWVFLLAAIYKQSNIDESQKADAIVILGASQWNGKPSPMFKARLDRGLRLYRDGYAPIIVLTGGIGVGEKLSEADVGRNYLQARGVPMEAIFFEDRGRTTYQSLRAVADIFKQKQWRSALLVSHDFHMFRLKRMVRDFGVVPFAAPVISQHSFSKQHYLARESVVYVLYLLFKM